MYFNFLTIKLVESKNLQNNHFNIHFRFLVDTISNFQN